MNGRETTERVIMLWLPWATLAALDLMTTPPRSAAGQESRLDSLVRVLIRMLAAHGTMNAPTFHFEPSEYLLAMSEVLMRLP
jgi:hypothetical protein